MQRLTGIIIATTFVNSHDLQLNMVYGRVVFIFIISLCKIQYRDLISDLIVSLQYRHQFKY